MFIQHLNNEQQATLIAFAKKHQILIVNDNPYSFILNEEENDDCKSALCQGSFPQLLKEQKYFAVADVNNYYKRSKGVLTPSTKE